jgi:hypothetical protein
MQKQYIINHPSQLNSLTTLPFRGVHKTGRLTLSGNMTDHPQKEYFETELNRQYASCGCDTGARALLLGLLAGAGYSAYKYTRSDWSLKYGLLVTFSGLLIMAIAGKLYGLYKADKKLKTTVGEIQKQWPPELSFKEMNALCG